MPPSFPPRGRVKSRPAVSGARSKGSWLRETALVVVIALVLSVVLKTFFIQSFYIPSVSMEDTLQVNDRIMVNKLATSDLAGGDVVVFTDPGGWLTEETTQTSGFLGVVDDVLTFVGLLPHDAGEHLIKRIIGMPGDTVECCTTDGRLTVNGVAIDEPYLKDGVAPSETTFSVQVPEGHVWVMGDNRSNSRDSRAHLGDAGGGFVPIENITGRAFVITWPLSRITTLGGGRSAFAAVP